jgi:hypothetical protein
MSDGVGQQKIDFRPMLTDFLREIDVDGTAHDAVTKAMRTASLKA